MTAPQPSPDAPDQHIDITAAEWLVIIVTGFTGVFAGPLAIVPGAVLLGMFAYRVNPELMKTSKAGQWVRGLLPTPTPEQDAPTQTSTKATPAMQSIQNREAARVASGTAPQQHSAASLAMIDLATLAKSTTILLVGSRGSGKSTLLRAILAAKKESIFVYDPHAAPGDWPMASIVHNSEASISTGMASAYKRLGARRAERRKGIRLKDWPKMTLAADEWGSIVARVKLPESIDLTPGEVSTELMKEGRKFDIGFVAGAHGFTNKSLGCTGDQDAFMQSFDWIVHMGGFVRKALPKEHAAIFDHIPMGTNEQGGTFPLIVLCENPTTGEFRLLDMRGLDTMVDIHPAPAAPALPWEKPKASAETALLASMLDESQHVTRNTNEPQGDSDAIAAQRDMTDCNPATVASPTPAEIAFLSMSLSQGRSVSQAARAMKGYNGRTHKACMAKADYVKHLINAQPASDAPKASTDDDEEAAK